MINSRLQALEKAFIIQFPTGVDDTTARRSHFRHVVFSPLENEHDFPSVHSTSATFALILEPALKWAAVQKSSINTSLDAGMEFFAAIKLGFSALHYAIESATIFLALDEFEKF